MGAVCNMKHNLCNTVGNGNGYGISRKERKNMGQLGKLTAIVKVCKPTVSIKIDSEQENARIYETLYSLLAVKSEIQ